MERIAILFKFAISCNLQADIDDNECAEFVDALMNNFNIEELDLSGNLLGKSENLNALYPDLVTGGMYGFMMFTWYS